MVTAGAGAAHGELRGAASQGGVRGADYHLVMANAPLLRRDLPPEIPDDVDAPGTPKARGVVRLPLRVNWSDADPTYDLDDRHDRARVYEQVLAEGTAEDVRHFIDVDQLIDLWDELMLPRAVASAWSAWLATHRGVHVNDWREALRQARR